MIKKLYLLLKTNLLFLTALLCASLVRFVNFSNRVNYGPEQAMTLITSAKYLNEKVSLLGQMYLRETASGYNLFSGATFNYLLSLLEVITNYDPIKITFFFSLLNLLTGALLYFFVTKKFNAKVGLLSAIFFWFNKTMIYHSFFIWNYNFLPLLFLVSLYFYLEVGTKKQINNIFWLALLSGIGISIQFLYIIPTFIFFVLIFLTKVNLKTLLPFVFGLTLGNLPMVVFDLRHDFYHLKTYYMYITEQLIGGGGFSFQYYHFIYLWPLFALAISLLVYKIYVHNKSLVVIIVVLYIYLNLNSNLVNFKNALGMPDNLSTKDVLKAAQLISSQDAEKFNVSETYDFDSRAHSLRFPITYIYNDKGLMGNTDYKDVPVLFVLSKLNYDYNNPIPWEINVFRPFKVVMLEKVNEDWGVFKLTK